MPATVGDRWFIGLPEIASLLFFIGLFIFIVFTALTKAPLLPKRNPFIEESSCKILFKFNLKYEQVKKSTTKTLFEEILDKSYVQNC